MTNKEPFALRRFKEADSARSKLLRKKRLFFLTKSESLKLHELEKEVDRLEWEAAVSHLQAKAELADRLYLACVALMQDWNAIKTNVVKDALAEYDRLNGKRRDTNE